MDKGGRTISKSAVSVIERKISVTSQNKTDKGKIKTDIGKKDSSSVTQKITKNEHLKMT